MKIDKGIIGSFLMLLGLVALIGGLYFSQYIYAILLGSLFQSTSNSTSTLSVTGDTFTANWTVPQQLDHGNITTLRVYNGTAPFQSIGLGNFTIDYVAGTIVNNITSTVVKNNTLLGANYSYHQESFGPVPLNPETRVFLSDTQSGFFTTMGFVNNGAVFAGGLIIVAVVIIVFGFILRMSGKKGSSKDENGPDY